MSGSEPATSKGRATRERIVESATSLVFERGVEATSLDDVRADANVSKGQLYHYFVDKGDLVNAVISRTIDQVLAAQPALADLSSWGAMETWFDQLVALQIARNAVGGCPIGRLAGTLAESDYQARAALADRFDRWQEPLRNGLESMRAAGELRADADPALLATATLASIQGGLVLTQTRRDPNQLRVALDAAEPICARSRHEDLDIRHSSSSRAQDLRLCRAARRDVGAPPVFRRRSPRSTGHPPRCA